MMMMSFRRLVIRSCCKLLPVFSQSFPQSYTPSRVIQVKEVHPGSLILMHTHAQQLPPGRLLCPSPRDIRCSVLCLHLSVHVHSVRLWRAISIASWGCFFPSIGPVNCDPSQQHCRSGWKSVYPELVPPWTHFDHFDCISAPSDGILPQTSLWGKEAVGVWAPLICDFTQEPLQRQRFVWSAPVGVKRAAWDDAGNLRLVSCVDLTTVWRKLCHIKAVASQLQLKSLNLNMPLMFWWASVLIELQVCTYWGFIIWFTFIFLLRSSLEWLKDFILVHFGKAKGGGVLAHPCSLSLSLIMLHFTLSSD